MLEEDIQNFLILGLYQNEFIMIKKLLLTTFYVLIFVLCAKTNGNPETEHEKISLISIDYDSKEKTFRDEIKKDATKFAVFRSLLQKGMVKGLSEGYKVGYEDAESKFFIPFFECFLHREKTDLEVYKDEITKLLYKNTKSPNGNEVKNLMLPKYVEDMITENDDWINLYDAKVISNGNSESSEITSTTTNPPTTKSLPHLVQSITKLFRNWYLIVTCKGSRCPQYIGKIQNQLKRFFNRNRGKYADLDDVYQRFAACMARSYKMMRVMYYKLIKDLKVRSELNATATFSDLLFECVPTFYLTYEHFYFLNVLRRSIETKITPLKYFIIENRPKSPEAHRQWTVIPYDNSLHCNVENLKAKSTIKMATHVFYPMDSVE